MTSKPAIHSQRHFAGAVALPVVAALVFTAAAVIGFVFWSSAEVDQRALERQTAMVAQVITAKRPEIQHDLESVAIWDDAVINTKSAFNLEWVEINLGDWMYDFFGHDLTIVLDGADTPIYVMRDGEAVAPKAYLLTAPLRASIAAIRASSLNPAGRNSKTVSNAEFATVDGKAAIVSAMAIVSDTGKIIQQPGTEPILLSVVFLGDDLAQKISRDYLFENARFTLTQTENPDKAVYPILNRAGRFISFFEWARERPGLYMFNQTGPALLGGLSIACLLVYLLLRQLHRSTAALEAGRHNAEHLASHDRLTGLPNRMSFDTYLAKTLGTAPSPSTQISVLMLDLDRFKQVNDTLGHQAGDTLIRAVGDRLRAIATPGTLIARLGGDEFALIVNGARPVDAIALSERIIEAISHPFEINGYKAHVGVSVGIINATLATAEPREMVRKADIALYEAKAGGRNRAVVYEEHMNELLQLQHTIEGELREALGRDDQLSVAFQPLIDQKSRKIIGAEALARWNHPKFGHISPARFIPVAENSGLIEALGEFVLRRACELGATVPGRTIAVNISPTQLRNPNFSSQVFDILHQSGMRPLDLELEITESILLDEEHISSQNLRTFRQAGIHIALDDFGTGYSSLSYLKRYPVDRIKIDRSFVSQLADGHVSVVINQAIVTLAKAMHLTVTAEGVETEDQARILGKLGCDTLQGFLFSGAVSREKIAEIFADSANTPIRRRISRAA